MASDNVTYLEADSVLKPWNPLTMFAFRLCFLYFGLYVLTTQMLTSLLPFLSWEVWATRPFVAVMSWVAKHVLRITYQPVVISGSGDKALDWAQALLLLAIAIVATVIWTLVDRRRELYGKLYLWFRIFIRFSLAATMLTYGFAKALPLQMPYPNLTSLMERYGDFSPMGVLWSSIGAATGYQIFCGCAELLGGILLFLPRTTMLGALVCLADTIDVFTLNMTYDVPVKLFSFHLILLSLFLLAPDAKRLLNLCVLDCAAPASTLKPLFRGKLANRIALGAQILAGAGLLAAGLLGAVQEYKTDGGGAPKAPLYGIWNVQDFTLDGQTRPPLTTDKERWQQLIFDNYGTYHYAKIELMDDSGTFYMAKVDTAAKTIEFTKNSDKKWKADFTFRQPAAGQLVMDGAIDGHKVDARMQLFDRSKLTLVSRGFHWVQEYPYNH